MADATFWSTFSGVGGFDLGLERAGFTATLQAEGQEADHHTASERAYGRWCRRILAHHWPDVPRLSDVRDVAQGAEGARPGGRGAVGADGGVGDALDARPGPPGRYARGVVDPPRRDRAGRPRAEGQPGRGGQDAEAGRGPRDPGGGELHALDGSAAGRRPDVLCGGFPCQDVSVAGKRAGLAGARSGLFYEFARIADAVRPEWVLIENVPGLLTSHGGRDFGIVLGTLADLGYGLAWRVLDSRYFGVPQRRRRVFVVGRLGDDGRSALRSLCESCPGGAQARAGSWSSPAARPGGRAQAGRPERHYYVEDGVNATLKAGGAGGPPRTDRLPLLVEEHPDFVAYNVTPHEGQGADLRVARVEQSGALDATALARSSERGLRIVTSTRVRRLTPRENERLQGFPDDWTAPEGIRSTDAHRYGAMGNAVTVPVAEFVGRGILQEMGVIDA